MKSLTRFFAVALTIVPFGAYANPVPATVGSNLTAYNAGSGALNNNAWATATNSRNSSGAAPAKADFGNCNSLILRCAQPKCSGGGCSDMTVASTIVRGCVQSSDACKKHGDDLVNYISAQLVADSAAAANAAQSAAANAAAQQSAAQLQQMQAQMQQMQADMAAQNAAQMQQMQAALEEQKQIAAAAQEQAAAAAVAQATSNDTASGNDLSEVQKVAAASGVSQDALLRETMTGEMMTKIENAEVQLKKLEQTMQEVFKYAGCDEMGDNCEGPKRVSKFKDLAKQFFSPYENVTDEIYNALMDAMLVGVNINEIMMLLNNSCNRWGEYWCRKGQETTYNNGNCSAEGRSFTKADGTGPYGNQPCKVGSIIPESDNGCRLVKIYQQGADVTRSMLWGEDSPGENGDTMQVACATDVLFSNDLFRGKAKPATIDIETLQRMITQDEGRVGRASRRNKDDDEHNQVYKKCAIDEDDYNDLQTYISRRTLPTSKLCISESTLNTNFDAMDPIDLTSAYEINAANRQNCMDKHYNAVYSEVTNHCYCAEVYKDDSQKVNPGRWNGNTTPVYTAEDNNNQSVDNLPFFCDEQKTIAEVRAAHAEKCQSGTFPNAKWTASSTVSYSGMLSISDFGKCDCGVGTEAFAKNIENCAVVFDNVAHITDGRGSGKELRGVPTSEYNVSASAATTPSTTTTRTGGGSTTLEQPKSLPCNTWTTISTCMEHYNECEWKNDRCNIKIKEYTFNTDLKSAASNMFNTNNSLLGGTNSLFGG